MSDKEISAIEDALARVLFKAYALAEQMDSGRGDGLHISHTNVARDERILRDALFGGNPPRNGD